MDMLKKIHHAALQAADAFQAVLHAAKFEENRFIVSGRIYDLSAFERIIVVGAGKASSRMAMGIEKLIGPRIDSGLVIVKEGHAELLDFIEQAEASHPIPDEAGMLATRRIIGMLRAADEKTLVVCLLSGGASALLCSPAPGLTLQDKKEATSRLLKAGATISELNVVRKHLSCVKGGLLAQAACPAQIITLLVSDVIGDGIDVIASGPTSKDGSTFSEALDIANKYGLSEPILKHLKLGTLGKIPETPKEDLPGVHHEIVASNRQALAAARKMAIGLGYDAEILSGRLQGEAREAGWNLAELAKSRLKSLAAGRTICLISGGETTVSVKGNGKGGRNQEMALAFSIQIEGIPGIELLSAATDGTDGPTDAAGAFVDGDTARIAKGLGIDPCAYLESNDSYGFFAKLEAATGIHCHYRTGPTGTNVMDIQIILIHPMLRT